MQIKEILFIKFFIILFFVLCSKTSYATIRYNSSNATVATMQQSPPKQKKLALTLLFLGVVAVISPFVIPFNYDVGVLLIYIGSILLGVGLALCLAWLFGKI